MNITWQERNEYVDWLAKEFRDKGHVVTPPRFEHEDSLIPVQVERFVWSARHLIFDVARNFAVPTESPADGDRMFLAARSHLIKSCKVKFELSATRRKLRFKGSDSLGDFHFEMTASPRAGFMSPLYVHIEPVALEVSKERALDEVVEVRSGIRLEGSEYAGGLSRSSLTYPFEMDASAETGPAGDERG